MRRGGVIETFSDVVRFGKVLAAQIGGSLSVALQTSLNDGDAGPDDKELWGHAPLLYSPLPGAETMEIQLGDEQVVFATKDRRWQISVGAGDVVLRAMGPGAPGVIHLKPDGSILLGGSAATESYVKISALKAYIDAVNLAVSTAIGGVPVAGAGLKATLDTAVATANSTLWNLVPSLFIKGV